MHLDIFGLESEDDSSQGLDRASPFDASAKTYDEDFTATCIGRWQRRVVWDGLEEVLSGNERVLEVGCGTGEDALFIARLGCTVTATDGSECMVAVTERKISGANLQGQVRVQQARLPDLAELGEGRQESHSYDRIFSDFGALNCLDPEGMKRFLREVRQRLLPGGKLVLVLMPEACWWESLYFLLRGRWNKVLRRRHSPQRASLRPQHSDWNEGVARGEEGEKHQSAKSQQSDLDQQSLERQLSVNGQQSEQRSREVEFDVWYYSLSSLVALAPGLRVCRVGPVGFLVPPSFMERWFRLAPGRWLGTFLAGADRKLARRSRQARGALGRQITCWFAGRSDHYWVELEVPPAAPRTKP